MDGPLQTLGFLFRYEIQNGGYGRTWFNIGPYGEKCFSETTWTIETKLPRNDPLFYMPIGNPRWPPPQYID